MAYHVLAQSAMLLHFAFLAYVALGGFLAWKWPHTFWPHLCVALYALAITLIGWPCPLTHVENWGRLRSGREPLAPAGFIDHYLTGVLYPDEHLITVKAATALLVALSWIGLAAITLHRRAHRPPG
ncbi:DUF2784 domain-containing protein [Nocardiopsis sp. LOL_012]|uniref:DUF2784 domain-containing protein n=1 Tax=Nocardiopsis sp. LOL_012 TaxID=3345409 RepID=UPI003A8A2629